MKNFRLNDWRSGEDVSALPETGPETCKNRGPRGYQRSDERIREEVCERLTWNPGVDASDIEVEVRDACVRLSGRVSKRRMKHQAEDCAVDVSGVKDVMNEIKVVSERDQHLQTTMLTGVY